MLMLRLFHMRRVMVMKELKLIMFDSNAAPETRFVARDEFFRISGAKVGGMSTSEAFHCAQQFVGLEREWKPGRRRKVVSFDE